MGKSEMKKNILFVYTNYSTFVKTDFGILSEKHEVVKYQFKPVKGLLKTAFQMLRQLFYLIFNIWKFDSVFIWFADYHSFLPVLFAKILGKKSFVVVGGYDVANIPELKYGSFNRPFRAFCAKQSFRYASSCLPVANSLGKAILSICPKAKVKVIYTGHDSLHYNYTNTKRKKTIFTLSNTNNRQRFIIKGLDRFRDLAILLKDFQFVIIGIREEAMELFQPIPENLILKPPANYNELITAFQESSFYAQFSRSEGLPGALCEAMLSGCIPLGSNVGDIKNVIGDAGFVFDHWLPNGIIEFIIKNHNNPILRKKARDRVHTNYQLSLRAEKIHELLV